MPSSGRQRGGVAAATAFYGNSAGGAAGAGISHRKTEMLFETLRETGTADSGLPGKSPRSMALWKQHKLKMAGMVTVVKRWDSTSRPWATTVTTPAPIQRRDFMKGVSPFAVQKFEQWHDRHPHLEYPREIPDDMFYLKRGKGPLPVRDNKGVPTARAYGGRHVAKLPGLRKHKTGRMGNAHGQCPYSLSNGTPQSRGRTGFLNAMFQDVGSGDGSWQYANPRALRWLPYELLRAEQFQHLTTTLTNLHFLLKKAQECGVSAVRNDLQQAEKAFKSLFRSGRSFEQATPMETLLEWQARVKSYRQFFDNNIAEIAALPATIFRLGAASQPGSHVHNDVQGAVLQAEHSISVVHTLLDPHQSRDADAISNIPRLLSARQFLQVVRRHGVWLAMDSTALDRIATAEQRAEEHIHNCRDRLQEPEVIDRLGQVLLRGPDAQSEHWEKDQSFASLTEVFGQDFFSGYEPEEAFACFSVVEGNAEESAERDSLLLEQLAQETGLTHDAFQLTVTGHMAALKIAISPAEHAASDSFEAEPARAVAQRIMHDACDHDSDLRRGGLVIGGPLAPTFWQEACVFITSTIADMQPERDMLSRFVLPALKLVCRHRRLRLSWVMCGADAPADLQRNLTWVKESCLSLPNGQTVPFSLALLGSKLGWIPGEDVRVEAVRRDNSFAWILEAPFRNWSLNQLEICQAQIREKDGKGFIFLRDPSFVNSEAFLHSALQVQEIFREDSLEAKDLDEDFKIFLSNRMSQDVSQECSRKKKEEKRFFEYQTVFVDGQVQDGGRGVSVACAGLFSFGLHVYSSLYKMIDSIHPTCRSSQPELCSVTNESEKARESQLQLYASAVVPGTRDIFIAQVCELIFETQDDLLAAINGPTGSGRTCIMAHICLRARVDQLSRVPPRASHAHHSDEKHLQRQSVAVATDDRSSRRVVGGGGVDVCVGTGSQISQISQQKPEKDSEKLFESDCEKRSEKDSHKRNFVFAWVIREAWHTEFDWLHCIASQVCRRAAGVRSDEYVGEVSMIGITNALWDMMMRGVCVMLLVDGLSAEEQGEIGRMFNSLQARSNAEWFGDAARKAALGRLKVVMSSDGFQCEQHRRVHILDVPALELEERLRICWHYALATNCPFPFKVLERVCATKVGAAHPRYLHVAMTFLTACQKTFPGQAHDVATQLSAHLDTLYEHDLLPFLEDMADGHGHGKALVEGDSEGQAVLRAALKETLAVLVNSKGLLPSEVRWVLQVAGQPGDDGVVGRVVERIAPYVSAHTRADKLLCLGCTTLQQAIARRYNLEIKEVPLHRAGSLQKAARAEAAAQKKLVHRRLLAEMEAKAGFKPKALGAIPAIRRGAPPGHYDGRMARCSSGTGAAAGERENDALELAPSDVAQDSLRDAVVHRAASEVVARIVWNAQQDALSQMFVHNARAASLLRQS